MERLPTCVLTGYSKLVARALFKKGQSGNLEGRPKGSKSKTTQIIEALEASLGTPTVINDLKSVFKKTIEMAKEGDTTAQKILWDRFMPVSRFEKMDVTKVPIININIGETVAPPRIEQVNIIEGETSAD